MSGRVTLVGAGPGDPDLLTVRAVKALGLADVVLYDALCDARVFALCPNAKRLYVGKRNRRHALPQETISALLVRFAKRGLRVVRLKAGDPFVFGRGREEVDHVQAFGIPGLSFMTRYAKGWDADYSNGGNVDVWAEFGRRWAHPD